VQLFYADLCAVRRQFNVNAVRAVDGGIVIVARVSSKAEHVQWHVVLAADRLCAHTSMSVTAQLLIGAPSVAQRSADFEKAVRDGSLRLADVFQRAAKLLFN